ncbi:MAG: FAD-dependent oxidoreductase [Pseudolabrys sp.]|nr:FAD-dependent oxidoreductase [Pseudolabrys sp.]MBV9261366.1 FAD-dependent oxidoreductase [Pseudolabrys sp.]
MANNDVEVAIIGGGAAGIAAARQLHDAGISTLLIEARSRLGGRAWTMFAPSGEPIDLGCGWLHSADRNPWVAVAERQGRTIDKTRPPWFRNSHEDRFPLTEQEQFREAQHAFFERLEAMTANGIDRPASDALEPGNRWNGLINAIGTYISGTEWNRVSAIDAVRYADTEINWRVVEGYGVTIASHGVDLPMALETPVTRIDHSALRLRIETTKGIIKADRAIITLPSTVIAQTDGLFRPKLLQKTEAARGLPLGLNDKLFLSLAFAEEFDKDSRIFGCTDRTATATYHMRPFGRSIIECYFGGTLAHDLESQGEPAFFDFASKQLTDVLGSAFARRIKPIAMHLWGLDPFARGAYSFAEPGKADRRAMLAAPVDGRLFFAGEATSQASYSTAHGAYFSGMAAAQALLLARPR